MAIEEDIVEGVKLDGIALAVVSSHEQRMDHCHLSLGEALRQMIRVKLVHQESDCAAMHAVDRLARAHEPVQGLQHEPVAAERDDDVGTLGGDVAVAGSEPLERLTRLGTGAGDKGYPLEVWGRGAHRRPRRGMVDASVSRRTRRAAPDRKSTRLNSSHTVISYAVFCLKKKK